MKGQAHAFTQMMDFQTRVLLVPRPSERSYVMQVMARRILQSWWGAVAPAERHDGLIDAWHDMTAGLIWCC
jgi:hypothetical protein